MQWLVVPGLLLAGVINLMPVAGVLGSPWLQSLYAVQIGSPDLEILLRHRAVLFAIFGLLLCLSAFWRPWRGPAVLAGLASMGSFIVVALLVGSYNALLGRIIIADVIGIVALVPALLSLMQRQYIH